MLGHSFIYYSSRIIRHPHYNLTVNLESVIGLCPIAEVLLGTAAKPLAFQYSGEEIILDSYAGRVCSKFKAHNPNII